MSTITTPTSTRRKTQAAIAAGIGRLSPSAFGLHSGLVALAEALRPHQWCKNLLVFVPFLLAHELGDLRKWGTLALGFAAFCACASGGYLLNDLLDLEADRRHPTKRCRPLAAGRLSIPAASVAMIGLLAGGFAIAAVCLGPSFTGLLALYAIGTAAYSIYFKRVLFLDILVLAGLYTLRMLAGGWMAQVEVSQWLRAFAMFFFISVALLKRFVELDAAEKPARDASNRRAYLPEDAPLVQTIGLVSGYLSVLVMCLYLSSSRVQMLYRHYELLWLIVPALVYWISRFWLLARRRTVAEDPVVAALADPPSYAVAALCVIAATLAAW